MKSSFNLQLSIREQIIKKVLETLEPVAEEYGAVLMRSPTLAITKDECPAIVLFPELSEAKPNNQVVERTLTLRIAGIAREANDDDAAAIADTLLVASHLAIMKDCSLGGLCQNLAETECDLELEDADATLAVAQAKFQVKFRTKAGNPAIKG